MVDMLNVAALPEGDVWPETIPQLEDGWYPTGGPVDPANDSGLLNWQAKLLGDRTAILKERVDKLMVRAGSIFTVGPAGDFATLNEALAELSEMRPAYSPGGFITELRLLAGYEMAEQVLISGINMGWITITSDPAEIVISRGALSNSFAGCFPAFGAVSGGVLPRLYTVFTMDGTGSAENRVGLYVNSGSATVGSNGGIKNAGSDGIRVEGAGSATATGADFSNAGRNGVIASGAASVVMVGTNVSDATNAGIFASNAAIVHAEGANASSCGAYGIRAVRSGRINAMYADARRLPAATTTEDISIQDGGEINAIGALGGVSTAVNIDTVNGQIRQ